MSETILRPKTGNPLDFSEIHRLEGFSDGAFSVIITLLVLKIHKPAAELGQLGRELATGRASYLAYAIAFVYVGAVWLNHHTVFGSLSRAGLKLNRIGLSIIGTTALTLFSTEVMAGTFRNGALADQKAAALLYAPIAAILSAAWFSPSLTSNVIPSC